MSSIMLPGTGETVPVGKIIGIGRNYARHAAEMNSPLPTEPVVFLKPSTALVRGGGVVEIPRTDANVHHEVELVVVIGREARRVDASQAASRIAAYAVGLDMTERNLQAAAKAAGEPWAVAKGFDTFAPLGPLVPADGVDTTNLRLSLDVNGTRRQDARTSDLIFSVPFLVAWCSTVFTLEPGDLIYTGTPEGVGPVLDGDRLEARIDDWPPLRVTVRNRK